MASEAMRLSIIADAVPALAWSSTVTPRHSVASSSSRPTALRCAATMADAIPPEHSAQMLALGARQIARTAPSASTIAPP